MDSNHHRVAPASPSSWCVYQFRHHRTNDYSVISYCCKKEISVYIRQPELSTKNRYFPGAAGACAGWPGAAGAAGAPCWAGAAGAAGAPCCAGAAGALFWAGADLPDMMEELFLDDERCARVSEVSMKSMAAPVVILFMKVLPPLAPNTVWLPPAPNDAPISAPLPDWSRTIPIMAILTKI